MLGIFVPGFFKVYDAVADSLAESGPYYAQINPEDCVQAHGFSLRRIMRKTRQLPHIRFAAQAPEQKVAVLFFENRR
jgi:hypothetical protein